MNLVEVQRERRAGVNARQWSLEHATGDGRWWAAFVAWVLVEEDFGL